MRFDTEEIGESLRAATNGSRFDLPSMASKLNVALTGGRSVDFSIKDALLEKFSRAKAAQEHKRDYVFAGTQMESSAKLVATLVIVGVSALIIMFVNSWKVRVDDDPEPAHEEAEEAVGPQASEQQQQEENQAQEAAHAHDAGEDHKLHPFAYMAFGRVKDHKILAAWHPDTDDSTLHECKETFEKLLKAGKSKLKAGDKNKLKSKAIESLEVFYFLDSDGEFMTGVGIRDENYVDKHAFAAVNDLMKNAHGIKKAHTCHQDELTDQLSKTFMELFAKFQHPEKDSMYGKALHKMHTIGAHMQQNTQQAEATGKAMHELKHASSTMDSFAQNFSAHSEVAVKKQQWELTKLKIIYGTIAFDILSITVIWVLL